MVEDYEVDPLRFANGRGDNNSTKKWELIASHLHKDGFVPALVAGTAVRKRHEALAKDAKSWLVRQAATCTRAVLADTAPQNAYGNPDKMPTGGAKTKKVEVDIETGEEKIEDWPFHAAMWLLKQTEDARQKYGKKFTAGKSHLGRAKTDKQDEIALAGKEIAGITAKLAGMPKSHKDRAETESQLVELRERIAELRGVKLEDDATAADEGAGGTSGVAAKARVSSGGGPAGLASALEPIIGKVEQIAGVLKETAEEADKRRAHEYKMAQLQSQTQIESARLQAEAFANAIARAFAGR